MAEQQAAAAAPASGGSGGGASAPASTPSQSGQSAPGGQQDSGTQGESTSTAPSNPVAAAIRAKASARDAGQAKAGADAQPQQQAEGEPPASGPEGLSAEGMAALAGEDAGEELAKWVASKGVELGDALKNPAVQKLLGMHRNLEGSYTKDRQALKELQEKEKTWLAQQQVQPEADQNPVDALNEKWASAVATLAGLNGCANEADYAAKYPQAYAQLRAEYDQQYREALRAEMRWESDKGKREQAKAEREAKLAEDLRRANAAMQKNVLDAKAKDPAVETNLVMSGAIPFVTDLGKTMKVPNAMILAHPKWFPFLAEAAHAIMAQRNIDKTKESWRQEYEKGLADAARASSPSPLDPTPPDNKAVLAKQLQRKQSANVF